jgi:mitogen-activated protein kinase 1/3
MQNIFDDPVDCKRILREICLLRKLQHPLIIELVEIIKPSDPDNFTDLYVVLEYAESDLNRLLKSTLFLEPNQI